MKQEFVSMYGPKCPYCGHEHTDAEDLDQLVTCFGSDGETESYECIACDRTFMVAEHVARTWVSNRLEMT